MPAIETSAVTGSHGSHGLLPSTLRLGPVHLTVSNLERSLTWYRSALGLHATRRGAAEAAVGSAAGAVAVLHEDTRVRPAGAHAGLYHYALLYPDREELARAALRLARARAPLQGMSDHGTHEAIYLADPDGNGIELAADRPRERWPASLYEELAAGGPRPLDIESLRATVAGEQPHAHVAEGLRVGHLHLFVGDLERAFGFYRDILGFQEQANLGGSAGFVSAGGYHHHLAFNTWRGRGVGPAPEHTAGLVHWTIELPSDDDVDAVRARFRAAAIDLRPYPGGFIVRDPWEIALAVVSATRARPGGHRAR
jgi:catechol 2,3-dioxygenase